MRRHCFKHLNFFIMYIIQTYFFFPHLRQILASLGLTTLLMLWAHIKLPLISAILNMLSLCCHRSYGRRPASVYDKFSRLLAGHSTIARALYSTRQILHRWTKCSSEMMYMSRRAGTIQLLSVHKRFRINRYVSIRSSCCTDTDDVDKNDDIIRHYASIDTGWQTRPSNCNSTCSFHVNQVQFIVLCLY